MVQHVWYLNGSPSHMTLPFEYWTPTLSGIQVFSIQMITVILKFQNRVTSVGSTLPPLTAKEKPPINVVGDVGGKIAIMVDDMIDDVQVIEESLYFFN